MAHVTVASSNGRHPATAVDDERLAAVNLWRQTADEEGRELTGLELGERFGRSDRWGRERIAEARGRHATATPSKALPRARIVAVIVVALVAAVVSYDHQRALAAAAGESWRAWLLPLSVDGMLLAASLTALERRRAAVRVGLVVWLALILGIGASIAANIAAAAPTLEGRLVAAWAPLALLLALEMHLKSLHTHTPA